MSSTSFHPKLSLLLALSALLTLVSKENLSANQFHSIFLVAKQAIPQKPGIPPAGINQTSSNFQELKAKGIPFPDPDLNSKWQLGVTLGINTTITDYERKTMSVLPFVGLFARKAIHPKWDLQLEAQIKPVTNYEVTQRYEEDVYSSLGFLGTAVIEQTYQGFVAVEFPVVVKYAATNRTGLLFGARYSFISPHDLATSSSGFDRYEGSLYSRIPQKGFWRSDLGLILGAEYDLGTKWQLSMRYAQGLRDITPDNLYNDTKTHLNSDLQVALHHYF